ncbi:unnamed protein product, partial [Notodromas monacha]
MIKSSVDIEALEKGILERNPGMLSKAITLVESKLQSHQDAASLLLNQLMPYTEKSVRIGITGVPGVGKSTFIESFGGLLTKKGHRVAVLAVDPSSPISKGSILGDKTRMENLAVNPQAFIRPSASGGTLGGIAQRTYESILLCEAAGYDIILVETVGVGQSETLVTGTGDELQGIKRGIMEMADLIFINKASEDNLAAAQRTQNELHKALHLYPMKSSGYKVEVLMGEALHDIGIEAVWDFIQDQQAHIKSTGFFNRQRQNQRLDIFKSHLGQLVMDYLQNNPSFEQALSQAEKLIQYGEMHPLFGAKE